MFAFLGTGVGKFVLGLIMPVLIGAVKQGVPGAWEKIPVWLRPMVTTLLGAIMGSVTTLTSGATDLESVAAGALAGAAGGSLGKVGRDTKKEIMVA